MTDTIRTRADGSIDTGHYMAKARHLRSEQAHQMMRSTRPEASGPRFAPVLTVLALAVLIGTALPFVA